MAYFCLEILGRWSGLGSGARDEVAGVDLDADLWGVVVEVGSWWSG